MKKFLKVLIWLAAGLAILVIAAAIAVKIFFPPEKIKALIEKQAAAQLHRQVKLGDVSVSLFTGLGISNFSLSEAPDFSAGTFVSSEKFVVVPRLLPLLQKKVFIKELELVKPQVNVVRNADGKTFNFSSLTATSSTTVTSTASAPAEQAPSPLAFLVSKMTLSSGHISFVDKSPAAQSTDIDNLDLTIRNLTLVAPVEMKTSFDVKTKGIQAAIAFAGSVNLIKGSAKIKELSLASGESKILVSGETKELTGDAPSFDINTKIAKLEPSLLTALGAMPASLKFKDPIKGDITLKGTMAAVDTTFNVAVGALSLSGQGAIKSPADPSRRFKISAQTNEFPIAAMLGMLAPDTLPKDVKLGGAAKATVDVDGTADAGQLTLKLDGKPLEVVYGASFKKAAGVPMSFETSGAYAMPLALTLKDLKFTLSQLVCAGDGTYKSTYAFNLKTNAFSLEDIAPMVPPMQGYGLTGKTTVTMKVTSADVKGVARLENVAVSTFGVKMTGIESTINFTTTDTSGKMTGNLIKHDYFSGQKPTLEWNLTNAADMAKMAGTASMKVGPGQFQNIQKLTADSKAARILFLPITLLQKASKAAGGAIKLPSFDNIAYQSMTGDYTFKAGLMTVTSYVLDSSQIGATMKGTVGLTGAQPLNLTSVVKAASGLIGGSVGEILNDEQGRATLNMTIKGTVGEPDVKVDTTEIKKKAIETLKEKYGDDLKKQGEKLLKGLFNR